jgi:hypothetical protein
MTAEWVTAAAAVGTLLVIVASAIAALRQIRHMRSNNQFLALTEWRETYESKEFREAVRFISYELATRMKDPAEAQGLFVLPYVNEYRAIERVANFFESMGTFVKIGVMDRDTVCDLWASLIVVNWARLAPAIACARTVAGPGAWENFEYLAVVATKYQENHRTSYPRNMARMPPDNSVIELVKASKAETEAPHE